MLAADASNTLGRTPPAAGRPGPVGIVSTARDGLVAPLVAAAAAVLAEQGRGPVRLEDPAGEADLEDVLMMGYPGGYWPFLQAPRSARRIAWFGEPLPRPGTSGPATRTGAATLRRAGLNVARRTLGPLTRRSDLGRFADIRAAASIERERLVNLHEALYAAERTDRIVTTSNDRQAILAANGVDAIVVPFGYHEAWAGPLTPPDSPGRDLPFVFLGSDPRADHLRRGRIVRDIVDRLAPVGELTMIDGVWGAQRDAILRRGKVLVDVLRVPGNFTGIRLTIGLAAGLVVVTEPLDDPRPFVPGEHFVSAPADRLAAEALDLVADEDRRRRIVESGQQFLRTRLTMAATLCDVLAP
ncbi:MAG: glycosyltransferase [Candidatus Limnocylindrales bacterium]